MPNWALRLRHRVLLFVVRPLEGSTEAKNRGTGHLGILDFRARAGCGDHPVGRFSRSESSWLYRSTNQLASNGMYSCCIPGGRAKKLTEVIPLHRLAPQLQGQGVLRALRGRNSHLQRAFD